MRMMIAAVMVAGLLTGCGCTSKSPLVPDAIRVDYLQEHNRAQACANYCDWFYGCDQRGQGPSSCVVECLDGTQPPIIEENDQADFDQCMTYLNETD